MGIIMKRKYHILMMEVAYSVSKLSYGRRGKVGAVLARDNNILKFGYNGTLSGQDNNMEIETNCACTNTHLDCAICDGSGTILTTSENVIHAEQNVISFCAREGVATKNSTLYITLSPCTLCAKLIAQSGISTVVYDIEYRDISGIKYLIDYGIEVYKYKNLIDKGEYEWDYLKN